jgi:hypothetical protein
LIKPDVEKKRDVRSSLTELPSRYDRHQDPLQVYAEADARDPCGDREGTRSDRRA